MLQLFIEKLTVIDCSYLHSARGLIGESWIVDITLKGTQDYQGMLMDFGVVKKDIKRLIDENIDHKLLVPAKKTSITAENTNTSIKFKCDNGFVIHHSSPQSALCIIESAEVNETSVTNYIINLIKAHLSDNITEVAVNIYNEDIAGAYYHYSHGLKKHDGNCQRIAHGHRSQIKIWENNVRNQALEQDWADKFKDIYIATKDDIKSSDDNTIEFFYHSEQGRFSLTIPKKQCYIIDTDSTVENIAEHICRTLKNNNPQNNYTVQAYEGTGKGAIFSI